MSIKVGITDDHPMVVTGLKEVLRPYSDLEVIWTAANGGETIAACKAQLPDVLLLDINLPDTSGIKLCSDLLDKYSGIKVIGLSSYGEVSQVKQLTNKGARGYLLKNTEGRELYNAIVQVSDGNTYYPEEIREALVHYALGQSQTPASSPKLTRREKEILLLIAEELTTKSIAEKLFISVKTVETHRQNLMQKLGAQNSAGLIKKAIYFGLL